MEPSNISRAIKIYQLGDICSFTKGSSPILKTQPGKYPLVTTGSERRSADSYQVDGSAVCIPLVSSTGHGKASIKRIHYQEGKFALANILVALIPNPQICYPKYLYYLLNQKKDDYLVPLMHGSANVSLDPEDIAKVKILLIPMSAQKQVVSIIDKINNIKRNQERRKTLIDELIKLIFINIFGDPRSNSKGWKIIEFGEAMDDVRYGTSVRCVQTPIGDPILRIPNVIDGVVNFEDLKHANLSEVDLSRYCLHDRDILFVRTNGNREYVGRCAVFHNDEISNKISKIFGFASYLLRIRTRLNRLNPDFACFQLSLSPLRYQMFLQAKTSAGQYNINSQGIKSVKIMLPPLPLQEKFASMLPVYRRLVNKHKELVRKTSELLNIVGKKAFEGQLVKEDSGEFKTMLDYVERQ